MIDKIKTSNCQKKNPQINVWLKKKNEFSQPVMRFFFSTNPIYSVLLVTFRICYYYTIMCNCLLNLPSGIYLPLGGGKCWLETNC